MVKPLKIHHIGYAVTNLKKAIQTFQELGYEGSTIIKDSSREIELCLMENDGCCIELVAPLSCESPVNEVLEKNGSTPYHFCYLTENIEKEIIRLENLRFKLIISPKEAVAFEGRRVAFLYSLTTGLIELLEEFPGSVDVKVLTED